MKYRVRLVLEFDDSAAAGEERFVALDTTGDPALAGAGATSAVLEEDAAFRLFGHLSEALERGLELETGSLAGLAGRVDVDGSRFGLSPEYVRCQSPLEASCPREAVALVQLVEPAEGDGLLSVCSPCGEQLWAEGSTGEPFSCESGASGEACLGLASRTVEAPGYGAAGLLNACRPCAEALADPDVRVQDAMLAAGQSVLGPR